ncbi:beta-ketoacyl synthase chain length factor [Aureispira anguillae]|uniref:Beta-ketoacyl synthase chain length factor n=1 Tax=Aureispira anguillae TaxID=2864201 RepID=A0A916DVV1_9BACT|nr:beta-ketoacyl synthase chain length factor [Aureispira anguillae]BDS13975.1 beta-ketoacyl synthase chain length factor [Aureispira anguillae]
MYIIDMSCISSQDTYYSNTIFEEGIKIHTEHQYWAVEPKYKKMVPLNLLRRMSKSVRMGVGTGIPLMNKFQNTIDGIIIGSANGSIKKSISFLNQIVEYNEGTLTPTDFIQSTSNSIAGTLALMGKITGYNNTHVNNGIAFESAVLDALLLFEEKNAKRLLLGGVEEISQANYNIDGLRGMFKEEDLDATQLLNSGTPGTVFGEGAALFVVDAEPSEAAIAQIVDVDQICYPSKEEIVAKAKVFLERNQLKIEEIDALFLGFNGDNRTDYYYEYLQQELFPTQSVYVYKNLVADYYTVSSFAVWLVAQLFSGKKMPKETLLKATNRPINKVLIYNHYEGTQHGFILMARP